MNKLKYIIASLLALMLSGCNSFLELSPKSQVNENGYYKTEEDFTTSMHAVYATLHTIYAPSRYLPISGSVHRTMLTAMKRQVTTMTNMH